MISKIYTHISTAEQLATLPSDGNRYELIEGILYMMSPAGSDHGRVAMTIGALLYQHVKSHRLGETFAAETGFRISSDPDTVRAPDAAFVSQARLDASPPDGTSYLPLAPDLVVEVISPNDVFAEVERKASQWLAAGSRL
ncbi:MAG: Uma2 family endonuclease, partial [Planctomycetota bacterium]